MPEYELIYFEARGKGEHLRYLFHLAGQKFKDTTLNWAGSEWPELKPKMPFGVLPVLKVDGKYLSQSTAIARFLANEFGLNGETSFEKALCDQYVDGVHSDLYQKYTPVYMVYVAGGPPDQANENFKKFKETDLKVFLDRYEKFLADNGTGYFVGKKMTWADVTVAEILDRFQRCFDPTVLDGHPGLAKLTKTIHELPAIKEYVDSRPHMIV